MKEDAQLICPLAYEDPYSVWDHLNKELSSHFPLRDITWKSPQGTTVQVTIDKLSVRCIPSGANLFKDTDHPFRWFLAPYVNIYIFVCDTMESYKGRKAKLKQWIDALSGPKRSSWLVVYLPMGKQSHDSYQKIYSKLSSEIYFDKVGDRTSVVYCNSSHATRQACAAEVIDKIKDGIIISFYQRCSLYDSEIRRLDAMRGTSQLDFRQLYLVKESLALMFQMMQLPSEALLQYEELESLLAFAPLESLPDTDWPFVPLENTSSGKGSKASLDRANSNASTVSNSDVATDNGAKGDKVADTEAEADAVPIWMCVCHQGLSLLRYSINHARMKVLKNQIGVLELQHYVFSRTCFFLFTLARPAACAEKAIVFLKSLRSKIQSKFDMMEEKESLENNCDTVTNRLSVSLEQLNIVLSDGMANNLNGVSKTIQRSNMADLWMVVSAIQVTKKCREVLSVSLVLLENAASAPTNPVGTSIKRAESSSDGSVMTTTSDNAASKNASSFISDESVGIKCKALSKQLLELLALARDKLSNLIYTEHRYREISLEMATLFLRWDDYASVAQKYPMAFNGREDKKHTSKGGISHCHPNDDLEGAIGAVQKKIQILMQYNAEFTDEELHSKSMTDQEERSTEGLFVSNSEILDLESEITVIVLRLQIENEEIAGRWRFVCRSLQDCADVLITNGKFSLAACYLRAGLEGTMVSPDSILTRCVTPQASGTVGSWGQIRVASLRKLLLCYRALEDDQKFVQVSLLLLDPNLKEYISLDARKQLQHNIVSVQMKNQIKPDTSHHFKLDVLLSVPKNITDIEGEHSKYPMMSLISSSKHIHDETFTVHGASCPAGQMQCIFVKISNNFPEEMAVDDICVEYSQFAPVVHGREPDTLATSSLLGDDQNAAGGPQHDDGRETVVSSNTKTFLCYPFEEYYNKNHKIVLQPGTSVIGLKFAPPCCGEFSPVEMRIKLNSTVTFVQHTASDLNKLHQYFENNLLVDVVSPNDALKVVPFPHTFSPVGHHGTCGLTLVPEATDVIKSLTIHANCVSRATRPAHNELVKKRKKSISLVADALTDATDGVVPPMPDPQYVQLSTAKDWTYSCQHYDPDNSEALILPTISSQACGLTLLNMPQHTTSTLRIPFETVLPNDFDNLDFEDYDIILTIQGNMSRNGCVMDFELQVEQLITIGDPLFIAQSSTEMMGNDYFLQCVVRNISFIPWLLHNFTIDDTTPPTTPLGKDNESKFTLVENDWSDSSDDPVVLLPGEYFNVSIQLRREGDGNVELDAIKRLNGFFPLQKFHEVVENSKLKQDGIIDSKIYQQYNQDVFNYSVTLAGPIESALAYSLDYHLHAIVAQDNDVVEDFKVGCCFPITYKLDVIFPVDTLNLHEAVLVASISCTHDWAVLGTSKRVVCCSKEHQNLVEMDVSLIAVRPGVLGFPPMKVTVFENMESFRASLSQSVEDRDAASSDSIELIPDSPPVRTYQPQPMTSIASLLTV